MGESLLYGHGLMPIRSALALLYVSTSVTRGKNGAVCYIKWDHSLKQDGIVNTGQ